MRRDDEEIKKKAMEEQDAEKKTWKTKRLKMKLQDEDSAGNKFSSLI